MKEKERIPAGMKSPIIEAVVQQSFSFPSLDEALRKLESLREHFITSAAFAPNHPEKAVLWIRDYALTPEELASGRVGNYAQIGWKETDKGNFTLHAEKLEVELSRHPQRKRDKQKHPDWGFYILRHIKKNKHYDTMEAANSDLAAIAAEFPEVSVLATNKLYTVIYNKKADGSSPLDRMVLSVEIAKEGGFYIAHNPNTFKREDKAFKGEDKAQEPKEAPLPVERPPVEQKGKFVTMIEERRNRKKRK